MKRQSVTQEEAENIINATTRDIDRLYITLLWYTGGRSGEVRILKPENIGDGYLVMANLKQHKTYVDKDGVQKAIRHPRSPLKQVFVPQIITDMVKAFVAEHSIEPNEYIFSRVDRNGIRVSDTPWSKKAVWNIVKKAAEVAGVLKVNRYGKIVPAWPHTARHGQAEMLYRESKDILLVQSQLGHSNLDNTKIYIELTDQDKRNAIDKIYSK